jgi:hypothetical protein
MSIENLNQSEDVSAAGDGDGDLKDALSDSGESEFVSEGEGQKKSSPLVAIGLVLAVLGAGYLWYSRSGPAGALAAAAPDAASETVTKFLDGGTTNVVMMEKMLRETEKVVQQFLSYPSMKQIPLGELQTNPFRFRAPQAEGEKVSESEAAAKKRREAERQAVIKAVGGLNLQSVIHSGNRKACMINNTLYSEGDQVDTFVVEKINPGAVVVKSGVYRFELRMQK